jgi:hypothetical protein
MGSELTAGVERVIDSHVHLHRFEHLPALERARRRLGCSAIALACIVNPQTGGGNGEGFVAKSAAAGRYFLWGGLNHAALAGDGSVSAGTPAEQLEALLAAGADGVKLIEGKPDCRRRLGRPLDGDYYAGFFAAAERLGVPLLWHVADPEEFWDPAALPDWAARHGWGYGTEDVPKEQLYCEAEAVLERHPDLPVVLAHFYFLSADLERARRFLRDHPAVRLDLAPGVEMLFNFAARPDRTRQFFLEFADRILFGTDIGAGHADASAVPRAEMVMRFLATGETFSPPADADELLEPGSGRPIVGLDLPDDVLDRIFHANFTALVADRPRPLHVPAALDILRRDARLAEALSGTPAEQTRAGLAAEQRASA